MNLNEYVQNAIRTESRIEKVTLTDSEVFYAVLSIFTASGAILDMYKKNVFYGKEIDWNAINHKLDLISSLSMVGPAAIFGESESDVEPPKPDVNVDPRVFHALIGTATEATELMEALLANIDGKDLDYVNLLEEFGDIDWYQAIAVDAMGGDFEKILVTNIEKLRKRFPEKFTSEKAIERDLDQEREILEKGFE